MLAMLLKWRLDSVEDGHGETLLSSEKAKRQEAWRKLSKSHENNETVTGLISGKVKGGFTVEIGSICAFLPGSLLMLGLSVILLTLKAKSLSLKLLKWIKNGIILWFHVVLLLKKKAEQKTSCLSPCKKAKSRMGIVKNITDYGAFIDLEV